MANAPLSERDGRDKEVIWVRCEPKYFCEQDWTGKSSGSVHLRKRKPH
jgi:hypothetical protein